jgi:hypothetical protein
VADLVAVHAGDMQLAGLGARDPDPVSQQHVAKAGVVG